MHSAATSIAILACLLVAGGLRAQPAAGAGLQNVFQEIRAYDRCLARYDETESVNSEAVLDRANKQCGVHLRRLTGISPAVAAKVESQVRQRINRENH